MEKEKFKTNIDWVTYKVTGKLPEYLKQDKPILTFYPNQATKTPGRGAVHMQGYKGTLCSCHKDDFPKIREHFQREYDGHNLEELQRRFRKQYNLKPGRVGITRLEDCNLSFTTKTGSKRIDVVTIYNKKRYKLCRCYPEQKSMVKKDFKRMKNNPNFTIEKIQEKMKKKYNLKKYPSNVNNKDKTRQSRLGEHTITITDQGQIYHDGKYVDCKENLYLLVESILKGGGKGWD